MEGRGGGLSEFSTKVIYALELQIPLPFFMDAE